MQIIPGNIGVSKQESSVDTQKCAEYVQKTNTQPSDLLLCGPTLADRNFTSLHQTSSAPFSRFRASLTRFRERKRFEVSLSKRVEESHVRVRATAATSATDNARVSAPNLLCRAIGCLWCNVRVRCQIRSTSIKENVS